jgi:hypothetical protein
MSNSALIENAAQEFWILVGSAPTYPCDLQTAIILALPLELYAVARLRAHHVRDWARRVQIELYIRGQDRRLHGCLIAERGKGTIFFDSQDTDAEQRFTLAHELAHFLLDYQAPRVRAIAALGPSILPVLNSERPPTLEERLHAALSTVHLGTMSHFMERPEEGLPTNAVLAIENRADQFALELLAPQRSLQAFMRQTSAPRGFTARLRFLTEHLLTVYGLPGAIAPSYARSILHQLGEPTWRNWLTGSAEEDRIPI